jgi:MoaA/NifB/PqqE/SkfB family radical SAM enzyme
MKKNGFNVKDNSKKLDTLNPNFCSIKIVDGCFFKCIMCNYWKKKSLNKLSLEKYSAIVKDLKIINKNMLVSFYGGEPLMNKNVFEFISLTTKHNLKSAICTNAYLLDNKKIELLDKSGLTHLYISIDGATKDTHDFIRGKKGSFEKIIETLKLVKNKSFYVSLTLVIMKQNLHEVVDFVKWANKIQHVKEISLQILDQPYNTIQEEYWYRNPIYSSLWPQDFELLKNTFKKLISLKGNPHNKIKQTIAQLKNYEQYYLYPEIFIKKKTKCNASNEIFNIYDNGDVMICTKMSPIGNIYKNNLTEIWNSNKSTNTRLKMKQCKTNCIQVLTNAYTEE